MPMSNDPVLLQQLLSEAMPLFNKVFQDVKSIDETGLDNPKKYLVSELYSFFSLSNGVLASYYEDVSKAETAPEFREMSYPVVRRLLEAYFRIIFFFDDPAKTGSRFDSYLKHIENQYEKMLNDLSQYGYPSTGLNPATHNFAGAANWDDLKTMFDKNTNDLTNDNKDKLTFLYPAYRILSFYAHGNINKSIMEMVFNATAGATNNFAVVKIPHILSLIANHYLVLICDFWPDIKTKHGITNM